MPLPMPTSSVLTPAWLTIVLLLVPLRADATAGIAGMRWLNPSPQGNSVEALAFESDLVGYAVGRDGTSLRTTDGGVSWMDLSRPLDFPVDLYDLEVIGAGDLLAVGTGAAIYRSTDAGATWRAVSSPAVGRLTHLHRRGDATFSAVGDAGQRLLSTDGGDHWTLGPDTGLETSWGQAWLTADRGWITGYPHVAETSDGGTTWTPVVLEGGFEFFDIQFTDGSNGWLSEAFSIYRTTDGGASWSPMPSTPLYINTQLVFSDTNRILVCAGEGAEIYETTDDGASWAPLYQRFATLSYTDIAELPGGRLVVSSSDGDLLRSDDHGQTWVNSVEGPGDADRIAVWRTERLSDGRGYGVGDSGDWLRTGDDGATWVREPSPIGRTVYEMEFHPNELLGLAPGVGTGTVVARTTDGGMTWGTHTVTTASVASLAGIEFIGDDIVWIAYGNAFMDAPRIYRSSDSGQTWEPRVGGIVPNAGNIECISFIDADHGYVGGDWLSPESKLLRTTNGGVDWASVPIPSFSSRVWDMHWNSVDHGFLATRDGVLETTDGGVSWRTSLATDSFRMDWEGPMRGCVHFAGETFHLTLDGGASWTEIEMPWSSGVLDIEWLTPDRLWVSSYGSRILEIDLYAPADVEDPGQGDPTPEALPDGLRISSMPARHEVTIELRSELAGEATLAWYDATGRLLTRSALRVGAGSTRLDLALPEVAGSGVLFLRAQLPDRTTHSRRIVALK